MESPQYQSNSQDIANAIVAAGFAVAIALIGIAVGMCFFVDNLVHQALPWIH